jgi:hypothetical protein
VGSARQDLISFEYTWDGFRMLATFDRASGRGASRRIGMNQVMATFVGSVETLGEDQIEIIGTWCEGGLEYAWKADLGDY